MGDDDEGHAAAHAEQRRRDGLEVWPLNAVTKTGKRNDFFEEDEPIEDVLAAFEAGEKVQTEPPTDGVGWCAPSP